MASLEFGLWKELGEKHRYRSIKAFSQLTWRDVEDLGDFIVAVAPNAGPIALTKNPGRMTVMRMAGAASSDTLTLFTQAGDMLASVPLPNHAGRLLGMKWTSAEMLLLVFDDGSVDLVSSLGEVSHKSFSLFPSHSHERVEMWAAAGSGLAAVTHTTDGRCCIYAVYDVDGDDRTPVPIKETGMHPGMLPTCIALLDAAFTSDGRMEILLGTADKSIIVIDSSGEAADQHLDDVLSSPVLLMAVASSGKYIALFCENGTVTVVDTAFEQKLVEFDTKATEGPSQLAWCGDDSVALTWPDRGVLLIGPYGDWLVYDYPTAVVIAQEVDSLRVVTPECVELIQMVPKALVDIRSPGSATPAALLVAAAAAFAKDDASCDDTIRTLIGDDALKDAVIDCIAAATQEWKPSAQQELLRAASYGKNFDQEFDAAVFVDAAKRLRVLNSLRSYAVAMPMTVAQYDALTPTVVIDRLAARHNYRTALQLCDYLALPRDKDRVLVHWACAKVRGAKDEADEVVVTTIRRNLEGVAGVSYADIAAAADSSGRRRLATLLLDLEPRVSDRVPILLKMREGHLALHKALESGDTDLVYLALLHLRRQIKAGIDVSSGSSGSVGKAGGRPAAGGAGASAGFGAGSRRGVGAGAGAASGSAAGTSGRPAGRRGSNFSSDDDGDDDEDLSGLDGDDLTKEQQEALYRLVLSYPPVVDLLAAYLRDRRANPTMLVDLYLSAGRYLDAGHTMLAAAYAAESLEARQRLLKAAARIFGEGERAPLVALAAGGAAAAAGGAGASAGARAAAVGPPYPFTAADKASCAWYRAMVEEQVALTDAQVQVETERSMKVGEVLDASLAETLARLVVAGDTKRVNELRKAHKVADTFFWQVKVRALAGERDWEALRKFSEERSPIGYKPFVEACIEAGANVEGQRYADKIADYNERMDALIKLNAITAAAELAFKQRDVDRLNALGEMARTPAAQEAVEKALAALTGGRR